MCRYFRYFQGPQLNLKDLLGLGNLLRNMGTFQDFHGP